MTMLDYATVACKDYHEAIWKMENGFIPDLFIIDMNHRGELYLGTDIIAAFKQSPIIAFKPYILKSCNYVPVEDRGLADYFYQFSNLENLAIIVKKAECGLR